MGDLKDYLKKYMSSNADGITKKKRKKRPQPTSGGTTQIIDEEVDWAVSNQKDDDEDAPVIVDPEAEDGGNTKPMFRSDAWQTIREGERRSPSPSPPPTRKRASPSPSPPIHRKRRRSPSPTPPPPTKSHKPNSPPRLSDGRRAGLQTGAAIRQDAQEREMARQKALSNLTPSQTGQHAQTVYRDKHGKKVDLAAQKAELAAMRRQREAQEEKDMVWGKGVVQQREAEQDAKRLEMEQDRPLAVYVDDVERNKELMDRDRWGDPMAFMTAKKKKKDKDRPVYRGPPPPPNRFGIPPGYRWDGVDRSNGFETRYFQAKNQRSAIQLEAYKWSTEDM
ncbi:uncharacterized protein SPPG_02395 [Spizellomyces punctatus DAOM BR117]|uniref:Pre-mRNA-splicing factor CWC26 n=1 Tax=Spizellomyces punctatus (strain DAOM BR117) TaxID=645134 RepID=A0A0L0HQG8_SPIPD|nr:uncharacterized protein SPPG_02395 [Spizellomyces punctatus DAOM BR117]KND03352.1 hypothetical protein SPPG_02395 [Spizellomyces punctatus DAOM BR117]|eukprot:XP_016611391.1 hypothetical protein SPPG_02395 [Spizellomyces punctatus DAOM BR117]